MSALVVASRDALAEAKCPCGHPANEWHHPTRGCVYLGVGPNGCHCQRGFADALLASGVVRTVDSLADDLFDALDAEHDHVRHIHAAECCWPFGGGAVTSALAAALTPDASP